MPKKKNPNKPSQKPLQRESCWHHPGCRVQVTILKHSNKSLTALSAQDSKARQFLLPTTSIRNIGVCKSQTSPPKRKAWFFLLGFSQAERSLVPYLSDVACGVHKPLKLQVADLVLVHVEAVKVDSPGRALSILLDLRLMGAHGEHPSRNRHHLHSKHHPKGWENAALRSPMLVLPLLHFIFASVAFLRQHFGQPVWGNSKQN